MNTKCGKCTGTLEKINSWNTPSSIGWKCPLCGHTVVQRKRTPYKLNATRDIRKIRTHLGVLLERNPITDENREEWRKFLHEYLVLWTGLNKSVEQITIQLEGGK